METPPLIDRSPGPHATIVGGIQFRAGDHATFYDDDTVWVDTHRRLTFHEVASLMEAWRALRTPRA